MPHPPTEVVKLRGTHHDKYLDENGSVFCKWEDRRLCLSEYGKRTFPQLAEEYGDDATTLIHWWHRMWGHMGPHSPLVNFLDSFPWDEDDGLGEDSGQAHLSSAFDVYIEVMFHWEPLWPTVLAVVDWCVNHRHAKKVLVLFHSPKWEDPPAELPAEVVCVHSRNWWKGMREVVLTKFDFIVNVPGNRYLHGLNLHTWGHIHIDYATDGFHNISHFPVV